MDKKSKIVFIRAKAFITARKDYRLASFLFACIALGGTSQPETNLKLPIYILSIIGIFWILFDESRESLKNLIKVPYLLFGSFLLLNILFLIPLPPEIWASLPGRSVISESYRVAGLDLSWFTISMTPEKSVYSIFHFLPVTSVLLITALSASQSENDKALTAVFAAVTLSVLLGLIQGLTGSELFYLYEFSHIRLSSGFFSNANHQACLLVMLIPFAVSKALQPIPPTFQRNNGWLEPRLAMAAFLIFIMVGVALTQSVAGYALSAITLCMISLKAYQKNHSPRFINIFLFALLAGLFVVDFVFLGRFMPELMRELEAAGSTSRQVMAKTTLSSAKIYFPVGSGPGSFEDIYRFHQPLTNINQSYPNQAHNDYVQIFLELGVLGAVIITFSITLLATYTLRSFFNNRKKSHFEPYLAFVSLVVLAIHGAVDYPLRTISVSSVAMFFLVFALNSDSDKTV